MRDVGRLALCALAVACARSGTADSDVAGTVVSGTVTYRERIALPADAVVDVRLIDATRADAAAPVLAQKTVETKGRQIPIPFELPYDASNIETGHTYLVRAGIRSGDQLLFSTAAAHRVITGGHPTRVDLVLERVRTNADSARGTSTRSTVSLENTNWKLVVLGGRPALLIDNATEPHLRLDAAQRAVRGSTGCNGMNGSYIVTGDSLRFGQVTVTRRACVAQEMNRQEGIFLETLQATRTWRVAGDTLTISGEPGELARFVAVYLRE